MKKDPDDGRAGTRIARVMAQVRDRIAARALLPGARLPSVRAQAKAMGLSVSTVVEAYERLAAQGLVRSRPGSGFYVSGPLAPLSLAAIGPRLDREVDPLWISRQALEAGDDALRPGCGWLPASWMPEAALRRALRALARGEAAGLADYAPPQGLPALRQVLSRRLAASGVEAGPDRILLTESATHALDLVCRFLLEPGDTVLVDDPCYFNFHALLKAHRVTVAGVPSTPARPPLAAVEAPQPAHQPPRYVTNAAIQNPTGAVLSPVTAHRLLTLADRSDLVIVEDDAFADFEDAPAPRLAAFDGLSRVIHVGGFSKTLSAAVRCGFIAGRPEWIEALTDLKIATNFGGGRLAADLLLAALTDGGYRRHMETVRARLAVAMGRVTARLAPLGIRPWLVPRAGMFVWCRLPDGLDAAAVARACLGDGVILAPGNAFSPSRTASGFMRFNVAQSLDDRIFEALGRAMEA